MAKTYAREIERLRRICMAMPEATERLSHGEPTWFVGKVFCMLSNNHHNEGNVGFNAPAPPGVQAAMIDEDPARFYRPKYVGPSGWIGVRLDVDPDWDEIAAIVEEAYRLVAPKRLVKLLDAE